MSGRIAVGVSGAGSNLRALARRGRPRRARRRDRARLRRPGLPGARLGGGAGDRDGARPRRRRRGPRRRRSRRVAPDVVVLAGYMRIVGPAVLAAFAGRILNTHPSLLPAFPGAHAVRDALAHGARGHRLHGPPRRRDARRRPDRRPGGRRRSCPATTRRRSTRGSRPSSTGCCRARSRSCSPARSRSRRTADASRVDLERADAARPGAAPGAAVGVATRPGSSTFGRGPRRAAASSSSRPAARRGRCARPACR